MVSPKKLVLLENYTRYFDYFIYSLLVVVIVYLSFQNINIYTEQRSIKRKFCDLLVVKDSLRYYKKRGVIELEGKKARFFGDSLNKIVELNLANENDINTFRTLTFFCDLKDI